MTANDNLRWLQDELHACKGTGQIAQDSRQALLSSTMLGGSSFREEMAMTLGVLSSTRHHDIMVIIIISSVGIILMNSIMQAGRLSRGRDLLVDIQPCVQHE